MTHWMLCTLCQWMATLAHRDHRVSARQSISQETEGGGSELVPLSNRAGMLTGCSAWGRKKRRKLMTSFTSVFHPFSKPLPMIVETQGLLQHCQRIHLAIFQAVIVSGNPATRIKETKSRRHSHASIFFCSELEDQRQMHQLRSQYQVG